METNAPKSDQLSSKDSLKQADHNVQAEVLSAPVKYVFTWLLLLRFINASCVRTFFQPDEYFQALEPAWRVAFGSESGAWLTWEWHRKLRSSLHPVLFGLAYRGAAVLMRYLPYPPAFKSLVLTVLPKVVVQSVFAALGDFYSWRLATRIYGQDCNHPWAVICMTVFSPWQWYCSTRTFSNSVETTLTVMALYFWPWEALGVMAERKKSTEAGSTAALASLNRLRASLFLAAIAVLLRPTNLIIWASVFLLTVTRLTLDGRPPPQSAFYLVVCREIVLCGSVVLALSVLSDRSYFGSWTFPPYQWLHYNISRSLAVFYGQMPWHYYLSQGIPLLTTSFLPFAALGVFKPASFSKDLSMLQSNILHTLSFVVLTTLATLSVVSHKEVRFIYPLLPLLHILAAPYMTRFFTTPSSPVPPAPPSSLYPCFPSVFRPVSLRHRFFLANLLSLNLLLGGYLSLFHQPAPISVMHFLRAEFERLYPEAATDFFMSPTSQINFTSHAQTGQLTIGPELFALFLTPCHSTPWRSHLVYPGLRARALTCEPPLHTVPGSRERAAYLDEADRFYARYRNADGEVRWGVRFLEKEIWPMVHDTEGSAGSGVPKRGGEMPRYIVGFEGIGEVMDAFFSDPEGASRVARVELRRVWTGWNGLFNEDWRRRGRLVVWNTGAHAG